MKFLSFILLLLSFFVFADGPTPQPGQPVYYVATDGDNSNPGTEAAPWRTPLYAMRNAPGGSFVYIKAGEYDSFPYSAIEIRHAGTPNQWSVFRSFPGDDVTIDGRKVRYGLDLRTGLLPGKNLYHHYYGLKIRNYEKLAEGAGPSAHLILENIEMHTGKYGLRLRNCSFMKFIDVYVHHAEESGFSLRDCHDVLFKDVESSYNDDGKTDSDADGLQTYGGYNIFIENFTAKNNREDGLDLNSNAVVKNSQLVGNGAVGLKTWRRAQDNWAMKHITSIGNLYANNGELGVKVSEGSGLTMYHDTVVGNGEGAVVIKNHRFIGDGSPQPTYALKNNIFIDNGNAVGYGRGVDYGNQLDQAQLDETTNLYFNNNGENTRNFVPTQPLLVDALLDENFALNEFSPAIDAGILIPGLHSSQCLPGEREYDGLGPDLGWKEEK